MNLKLVASTIFGLEAVCAKELRDLGFTNIKILDGRVIYDSDLYGIAISNMWLRTAERVYILLKDFEANDFTQLYDGLKSLPFEQFILKDSAFPVYANCIRSNLHSVPAIQKISKKAVVDRLKPIYKTEIFMESSSPVIIQINLIKNRAFAMIDTSGIGLNRRGYREYSNLAPLKETLAAGLVKIANWKPFLKLIDLTCGSGTILIEAAMIRDNLAPGLNRKFSFEDWEHLDCHIEEARQDAHAKHLPDDSASIEGYDIDEKSIRQARQNAKKAGVNNIHFQKRDLSEFSVSDKKGSIISNLPYGLRLEDEKTVSALYNKLGSVLSAYPTWSKYFLTSHKNFENDYGEKATKSRKLYNAQIPACFYQYYGQSTRTVEPNKSQHPAGDSKRI